MTIHTTLEPVAARKTKSRHGGARKGAGRKGFIRDARRLSVEYPGEDFEALEEIADERGVSIATVIREAVREYLAGRGRR